METNNEYPLFTVIIPQKNRAEYLIHTLRTCMIQDYPNLEFIVADDCSDDNSVEIIQELMQKDNRIKLIAHKHHVGMRDNFESALAMVRPGYVMALGGDDGLLPNCFWKMKEIIDNTGAKLITWPTHTFRYCDGIYENRLQIRRKKFDGLKKIKSKDFLEKISKSFQYLVDDCPMFYVKGIASTELVDKVKSRTKDHSFYYCPTPDGFSGVVLAGEVDEYIYNSTPLSITGSSPKSQGLNYHRTDKQSRKEAQEFFNDNIRRTMHKELASQPYSPLVTLMTADYLLTAKDLPGWPGIIPPISFENLFKQTFNFISKSSFANEVLAREMLILKNIASQHNLIALYDKLLKNTKRRIGKDIVFSGFRLTRQTFEFTTRDLEINNIYDAALVSNTLYLGLNQVNKKWLFNWIRTTIKTIKNIKMQKRSKMPQF